MAWIGHFVFEQNSPAAFQAPFYSLLGDLKMCFELALGMRPFDERSTRRRRMYFIFCV